MMITRSWWRAIATAVVTTVLIAGVLESGSTTARAATGNGSNGATVELAAVKATVVRRVSPLNAKGHLRARYTVTSTHRGYCWTTSEVNGHLYRCFMGNYVMDPCWKESGRHSVVCLTEPWSKKVIRLKLTKHLPAKDSYGPGIWGLRIGGVGVNCVVAMGATGTVGTHFISYFCQRGWVLLGNHPDRSRPRWTMLTARRVGHHYELRGRKPLRVAWKAVR